MQIVGVSYDSPEKNRAWKDHERFPYALWSDAEHVLTAYYDAGGPSAFVAWRVTKVLDAEGNLVLEYTKDIKVGTHPQLVLDDVRKLFGPKTLPMWASARPGLAGEYEVRELADAGEKKPGESVTVEGRDWTRVDGWPDDTRLSGTFERKELENTDAFDAGVAIATDRSESYVFADDGTVTRLKVERSTATGGGLAPQHHDTDSKMLGLYTVAGGRLQISYDDGSTLNERLYLLGNPPTVLFVGDEAFQKR